MTFEFTNIYALEFTVSFKKWERNWANKNGWFTVW